MKKKSELPPYLRTASPFWAALRATIALPTVIVPASVAITALTRLTAMSPPHPLRLLPIRRARYATTSDRVQFSATTRPLKHRHTSRRCCRPLDLGYAPSTTTSQTSAMQGFLHTHLLRRSRPTPPLNKDDGRNSTCNGNDVDGDHHWAMTQAPSCTGRFARRISARSD